jgi:hypothetical protein
MSSASVRGQGFGDTASSDSDHQSGICHADGVVERCFSHFREGVEILGCVCVGRIESGDKCGPTDFSLKRLIGGGANSAIEARQRFVVVLAEVGGLPSAKQPTTTKRIIVEKFVHRCCRECVCANVVTFAESDLSFGYRDNGRADAKLGCCVYPLSQRCHSPDGQEILETYANQDFEQLKQFKLRGQRERVVKVPPRERKIEGLSRRSLKVA